MLFCFSVQNEYSPILPRSFCKGDWAKPNLKVTKAQLEPKNTARTGVRILKDTITKAFQRNNPISNSLRESSNTDKEVGIPIGNSNRILLPPVLSQSVPEELPFLNTISRLLLPPMAAVSYIVTRPYSDTRDDGNDLDVFWRPRLRIPDMKDPMIREEYGRDAKYLLLSFDDTEQKKEVNKQTIKRDVPAEPVVSKS